jgi:hypothetical protein
VSSSFFNFKGTPKDVLSGLKGSSDEKKVRAAGAIVKRIQF